MSANEIININQNCDEIRRISIIMAIHCAPLIKCIKAANIITVSARELMIIRQMLVGTDISYYTLKLIPKSKTLNGIQANATRLKSKTRSKRLIRSLKLAYSTLKKKTNLLKTQMT